MGRQNSDKREMGIYPNAREIRRSKHRGIANLAPSVRGGAGRRKSLVSDDTFHALIFVGLVLLVCAWLTGLV